MVVMRLTPGSGESHVTTVRLRDDQLDQLRELAVDEGRPVAELIRDAVDVYLAQQG
jgi:hypothetical protein